MDSTDSMGLEFLDLTDIDECERHMVLTSLQPLQSNHSFPWFIGDSGPNIKATSVPPPSEINNQQNFHNSTKTSRTPLTIINPENGLVVPLNKKTELVGNPVPVQTTPISINTANGPQINHQYYSPTYYTPPTVVTTVPNVSVHIAPANYAPYPHNSHPEVRTNTTIYPAAYTYPVKAPVYYGVPSPQTIFVPHAPNYQNSSPTFIPTVVPVEPAPAVAEVQEVPLHEESTWNSHGSPVLEQEAVGPLQNATKCTMSPLSADTPAFTPKSPQNVSLDEGKNKAWGVNKSWASHFGSKDGSPSVEVNGVSQTAFSTPANKTSNNDFSCPIRHPRKNQFVDPDCYRMGEFLVNYTVDGRTISLQPRGLINQSNYCYINSILQALIACPPMYNLLSGLAENISSNEKRKPTPLIDGMCKLVKEYKHLPANMRVSNRRSEGGKKDQKKDQGVMINTDIPFEPSWIYKILHGLQTDLMEGRQEDAEEFLGCLLNHLSDEMLELIKLVKSPETTAAAQEIVDDEESWQVMGSKNKGSVLRKTEFERTPITDIFGGSLKSRIQRLGGLSTENTQPFLTLQLNIEKVTSVREALESLTAKNLLEGLTSSKTNEKVEAWQQVMLDELPVVLILHLKCFDFQLDGCTKIVKPLEFPIDLKIDNKLLSIKTTNVKEKHYKLFAVVYHDGKEATKGHYVTDAFHVGYSSWLRYDDASVKPVQEEQVLNPQGTRVPYLLFYRRSDTIRSK